MSERRIDEHERRITSLEVHRDHDTARVDEIAEDVAIIQRTMVTTDHFDDVMGPKFDTRIKSHVNATLRSYVWKVIVPIPTAIIIILQIWSAYSG